MSIELVRRSYPTSEVRGGGQEELPHVRVRGQRQRGTTPCLKSGQQPRGTTPRPRCRRAERSYSTFKVRRGNLIQGKEQQLRFAGAAVKRYPTSKVRESWSSNTYTRQNKLPQNRDCYKDKEGYYIMIKSIQNKRVVQLVKNPPAMWETWVQSLG